MLRSVGWPEVCWRLPQLFFWLMPYLKVYLPETPIHVKRNLATALTETILRALNLPREHRMQTTVNFTASQPGSACHVEVHHIEIPEQEQRKIQQALASCLRRWLGLSESQKVTAVFQTYSPFDAAIGVAARRTLPPGHRAA